LNPFSTKLRITTFLTGSLPRTVTLTNPWLHQIVKGERGLNLTKATLNAILKYPWLHGNHPDKKDKWGAYQTEKELFEWTRDGLANLSRSPEAEIMDWADDITYAIHDLVDFYCAGLIPLHVLAANPEGPEWTKFFSRATARKRKFADPIYAKTLRNVIAYFPDEAYDGSEVHARRIWEMITILITPLVSAIKLTDPDKNEGRYAQVSGKASRLVTILQELTWAYVIQSPDLAMIQYGQRKMISQLFEIHLDNAKDGKWSMFPPGFPKYVETQPETSIARYVSDYISGLTERQIGRIHRKLIGELY
jgi:dGTPase